MIYSLKLHNRIRNNPQLFPFDRAYLVPQADKDQVSDLFDYYFYLPLTDTLILELQRYCYAEVRTISQTQEPTSRLGTEPTTAAVWEEISQTPYLIAIPTSPVRVSSLNNNTPYHAETLYSKALLRVVNVTKPSVPRIGLHTPTRDVSHICALCSHYPEYAENSCTPGNRTCALQLSIPLFTTRKEPYAK